MTRWQYVGATTFVGAIALTLWLSSSLWAQQPRLEYPRPSATSCVPNVRAWGHYQTTWRRWPGEVRLEEINPRRPGSQVIPTPQGREIVPLPKATTPQPSQDQVEPQQPLPQQPLPPTGTEKSTLPPVLNMRPTEGTLGGSGGKPGSDKPTIEGELPELLPEPTPTPTPTPTPPPQKPSGVTPPAKAPAKPAVETPKKTSLWEKSPAMGDSSNVTVVYPTGPAKAPFDQPRPRQESRPAVVPPVHSARTGGVVALATHIEPERNTMLPGAYRADAIGVTPDPSASSVEPAAFALAESPRKPAVAAPAAIPSVALGGYCPVELSGRGRWVLGDLRWTVVCQGAIYRLSGAEQRRQFLANPDRFVPANSGNDVVLSIVKNRAVAGQTSYCATYNNHLYMFSSQATQDEFNRNPERYAVQK
jgi:YHS domain-containing protein